jgi:MFS family permease
MSVTVPAQEHDGGAGTGTPPAARRALSPAAVRSLLRGPELRWFRILFAIRLCGQFADGTFQVALAAYVVFSPQNAATAAQVAQAFAVLLLPFTLVGPFAGVFLDRWPRQRVLAWSNLLRATLVVLVAVLVGVGAPKPLFYVGALSALSVNRFVLAGLSAALPHTVPPRQLIAANALSPTAGTLVATAGGAVGLVVHVLIGSGTAGTVAILLAAAGLYALAALLAATMPRRQLGPDDLSGEGLWSALCSVARGLADGARHVAGRPTAARALGAVAASRFCYGVITIVTLLLYRNTFNSPDQPAKGLAGFAFAVGLSGVGFGLGAVVTPLVTRRVRLERWIALCLFASALTELVFGLPFAPLPLVVGAMLLGVTSQGQKICTDTLVQSSIDDAFRGRVFVYYDMLYNGAFVLAAAFSAASLPFSGRSARVVGGIALLYGAVGTWYLLRTRGAGPLSLGTPAAEPTRSAAA